ncbi:type-1 angiotensin II receptor-associated protein-like isoform X1 [Palaemon carinicauda]|uniref:type-1 angiotensin II receptor-associated protein-like isoform X1 n=1 Tax=Palaemon carinicauda TaxID=392227 RepID=UPI0035B5B963
MFHSMKKGIFYLYRISFMEISHKDRLDILFGIFFAHLTLAVWSNLCGFLPASFLLYNGFLLATIIWSLHHRESEEAPFMALCINLLSIVFDAINFIIYWTVNITATVRFGAAMAVINLLLRPLSSFLLYRIVQDRAGTYGSFGLPTAFESIFGGRRSPYEDIDQPSQQNPSTTIDTDHLGAKPATSPNEALFTT